MTTMFRFIQRLTPALLLGALGVTGWAQETNLLKNGDFQANFKQEDNLLDGVNSNNELQLEPFSVMVVGTDRRLRNSNVPPGVAMEDINKDGKMDIAAASPVGVFYVYFNKSNDPAKPEFTQGEIIPIFLSLSLDPGGVLNQGIEYERRAPRFSFYSWTGGGGLDLTVGNLYGELFLIPGSNAPSRVEYRQPRDYRAAQIPTSAIDGRYWGNLFSPVVVDFLPDSGGPEIVMGEGSYSANSVFLLHSDSRTIPPKFDESNRSFLVVGEGREQLIPTVVDVNGDGLLDVLTADKNGQITVDLQPEGWKPSDGPLNTLENAATSILSIGGKDQLGTAISLSANDYNADGLFDLLIGQANGKLSIAINSGSKGEPKFDKLEAIKGVDKWGKDTLSNVPEWRVNVDRVDGNALGYWRIEPRGTSENEAKDNVLRGGVYPGYNRIVAGNPVPNMAGQDIWYRADQKFAFKTGERYVIEYEVKGSGVDDFTVWHYGNLTGQSLGKVNQDERGGVSAEERNAREWHSSDVGSSSVGPQWQSRRHEFTPKPNDRRLRDLETMGQTFGFRAVLNSPDSELYIDNVRLYRK